MKSASELIIFGDGGSRGNPGEAAYGFAIFDNDNNPIFSEGKKIGINTNNVAEYMAVLRALEWVRDNMKGVQLITFKLDSLLVASQMAGKFKIKHPNMIELYNKAKRVEGEITASVSYTQIPRAFNKIADKLVNDALDLKI